MDISTLTVIIPFYNGYATIDRLIKSIPQNIPVIIVDDLSDEKLYNRWSIESVKVLQMTAKGYWAGAVNRGIAECDTDLLILNQDVLFEDTKWLDIINQYRDRYAMIGERIKGNHPAFGELGYSHGTFLFLRRDLIDKVGLFDEKRYKLWGSTGLYQWQAARAGFKVLPLREIPGFHHERKEDERYGSSIKTLLEKEPEKKDILIRTPPLLSVIVLCHNYGRYLQDCINSLIGGETSLGLAQPQSFQAFEIIIVDDASTDNTPEFVKSCADITKGIRAYRLEKNVGTARALNYGIEKAVGKYITFLSADDMRESDSLEKLVEACEQNHHSFVYDDVWLFHTNQRIKKWAMEEYDFEKLVWKNQIHAGILFPKQAWIEVGGYPAIMNDGREDWAFNVALGIKGWCGIHVKQFGYLYRREGQNRTERNTTEDHRRNFLEKMMSLFPDIYRGERPVACCGKGGTPKKSNNGSVSALAFMGATRMANSIGSEGMVKVEYLGNQQSFTINGDITHAPYTFSKGRKGWVDKRDMGSRDGKTGFLSKKDKNTQQWLYRIVDKNADIQKEPIKAVEIVSQPEMVTVEKHGSVGRSEMIATGTLTAKSKIDFPNPSDLTVEEIKRLELSKNQWEEVYRAELSMRNRKGLIGFLEEKLAEFS